MKKVLIIVAVAVMMLVGSAFAGYDEAMQLYREKKYDEAITEYRKVASMEGAHPSHVSDAQLKVGDCFFYQKKYDEAITEYRKVAGIEGAYPHHVSIAQLHIGYSFYNQKKYDEAITEYRKVAGIEGAHPHHVSNAQVMIGRITKDNAEYAKVVSLKGAYINHIIEALGITGVTDDMAEALVMQVKTQTEASRPALLKKIAESPAVCREIVKAMPTDLVVLAELKPFLNLHELSIKEQAEIHKAIWMANLGRVVSNEDARAVVDGAVTALTQLLGLSENPSIAEVDKKIAEMK